MRCLPQDSIIYYDQKEDIKRWFVITNKIKAHYAHYEKQNTLICFELRPLHTTRSSSDTIN